MDTGSMVLSIYCAHMASKWGCVLENRPKQGRDMSVEAYYDQFFNWKTKLEEVNYIGGEESHIDDFLYGLKTDISVRVWMYKLKPRTLYGAFRRAEMEEFMLSSKENSRKNDTDEVFEEMSHPKSVYSCEYEKVRGASAEDVLDEYGTDISKLLGLKPNAHQSQNLHPWIDFGTKNKNVEGEIAAEVIQETDSLQGLQPSPLVCSTVGDYSICSMSRDDWKNDDVLHLKADNPLVEMVGQSFPSKAVVDKEGYEVLDKMSDSSQTGLPSFSRSYVNEDEALFLVLEDLKWLFEESDQSSPLKLNDVGVAHEVFDESSTTYLLEQTAEKGELLGSVVPVTTLHVRELLGNEVGQPHLLRMRSIKADHQMFERMPELNPAMQNNRAAVHGELVLPRDLSYGSEVTMGSFSISFKSMFEKVFMFINSTNHEFEADCWVDGILTFMFDPGGVLLVSSRSTEAENIKINGKMFRNVPFSFGTKMELFVWDPGQCTIVVYILEDKDVLKRKGIGVRLAWKQDEHANDIIVTLLGGALGAIGVRNDIKRNSYLKGQSEYETHVAVATYKLIVCVLKAVKSITSSTVETLSNVVEFYTAGGRFCQGMFATMELKNQSMLYNVVAPLKAEITIDVLKDCVSNFGIVEVKKGLHAVKLTAQVLFNNERSLCGWIFVGSDVIKEVPVLVDSHNWKIILVAANDVAFSTHDVLLTAFTLFQIAIYDHGSQKVSKTCIAIVSVVWLAAAVLVCVAIPHRSWFWLVSCFSTLQVIMTLIKYTPQAVMNFRRKSTTGFSIGNILLDLFGGVTNYGQMAVQSIDQHAWVNFYGNIGKTLLSLVSILFDILFILQHYVFYPSSKKKIVDAQNVDSSMCPRSSIHLILRLHDDQSNNSITFLLASSPSSLAVRVLNEYNVPISARNILEDHELKNAVKSFGHWPTFEDGFCFGFVEFESSAPNAVEVRNMAVVASWIFWTATYLKALVFAVSTEVENFVWNPGIFLFTTLRTRRLLRGRICHVPRSKIRKITEKSVGVGGYDLLAVNDVIV